MKTIIFVCHGNICRSVAAEYICKQYLYVHHMDKDYNVYSRATSYEEIGNDIYPPMKRALSKAGIHFDRHYATRINQKDVNEADILFYMDNNNLRNLSYMFNDLSKFHNICEFTDGLYEIDDPWYTDRHDEVVKQLNGCINDIFDKHII